MKKIFVTSLSLIAFAVGLTSASAQPFVGFDDFSTSSGDPASLDNKWAFFFRLEGSETENGLLDFSGSQLDFSKGTGAGSFFLGWRGAPPSGSRSIDTYNTSWSSEISVSSTFSALSGAGEFLALGIEIAGGAGQFSTIMLNTNSAGNFIRTEGSGVDFSQTAVSSNVDVRLRLTWDATTKLLVSAFSTNSGTSYTNFTTFAPDSQWTGSSQSTNGFFIEIWANSNATGAISPGIASLDNFVVAVPEPSTYALLATGLGLVGLSAWRKRRTAA